MSTWSTVLVGALTRGTLRQPIARVIDAGGATRSIHDRGNRRRSTRMARYRTGLIAVSVVAGSVVAGSCSNDPGVSVVVDATPAPQVTSIEVTVPVSDPGVSTTAAP
jgi:hypothetical protein